MKEPISDVQWFKRMELLNHRLATKSVVYAVYQLEVAPTTKQQHLQGYVLFKTNKTMQSTRGAVFKDACLNSVHLEAAHGTSEQNRTYCTKPDTAYLNSDGATVGFEIGVCPAPGEEIKTQGKRNDINNALNTYVDQGALACLRAHPTEFVKYHRGLEKAALLVKQEAAIKADRPVTVTIIEGLPGVGKSRLARDMSEGVTSYWPPMRSHEKDNVWFDGYDGQRILVLDNFQGKEQMPHELLLRVTDRYPFSAPCKGAHAQAQWDQVIITTSVDPKMWYPDIGVVERSAFNRRVTQYIKMKSPEAGDAKAALAELPVPVQATYEDAAHQVRLHKDAEALEAADTQVLEQLEKQPEDDM